MGGIQGADDMCYRQAHDIGLKSTFRAFLTAEAQDLDYIVQQQHWNLPVMNIRVSMFLFLKFG